MICNHEDPTQRIEHALESFQEGSPDELDRLMREYDGEGVDIGALIADVLEKTSREDDD